MVRVVVVQVEVFSLVCVSEEEGEVSQGQEDLRKKVWRQGRWPPREGVPTSRSSSRR